MIEKFRSETLTANLSDHPEEYYVGPRFIGTFASIGFSLAATDFAFEAAAECIVQINADIRPSDNCSII